MDTERTDDSVEASRAPMRPAPRLAIVGIVVVLFAGLLLGKALIPTRTNDASSASITSVRNDATADYENALSSGKPIYVLFHSLS